MKCNIEIEQSKLNELLTTKNELSLIIGHNINILFLIEDFKYLRSESKGFFGSKKEVITLIDINIKGWNKKGKFWGTYDSPDQIKLFLEEDLYQLRQNYIINIREPINELGYEFIEKSTIKNE